MFSKSKSSFARNVLLVAVLLHLPLSWALTPISQVNTHTLGSFNRTVDGRLTPALPWAESCFTIVNNDTATVDSSACNYVQQNYYDNHLAIAGAFGGYSATQYASCMQTGDDCSLDWTNPSNPAAFTAPKQCKQGSVPPLYVPVQNEKDVINAFSFVKANNVTLVVKNSGHDFQGRSSAPDSLALWMRNYQNMTFVPKFVPDGCNNASVTAITVTAGINFGDLYKFADQNNVEIVGGSDETVGPAGGFLQGGGHSPVSPSSGMGADRVLQYKVVTPDGKYRTANACQNSDLFYALRGGGGGTFGVVMESTVLATPPRKYQVATITWPVNDANLRKVLSMFVDNATALATQGWGGYLTPSQGNLVFLVPNATASSVKTAIKPLMDLSTSLGGSPGVTSVNTFYGYFSLFLQGKLPMREDNVGLPNALTSRLIPEVNHRTAAGRKQLVDAMMTSFNSTVFSQIHFTTPFGYKGSDGSNTPVHPAWRTSLYQILWVNTWMVGSSLSDRQAAYAASTKAANYLRAITPNSAAYHNEGDIHEPDWQTSFFGPNYNTLLTVKNKYDPDHLLDCWHCVGWKGTSSPQFKCYI